jgi:hypothetical protein
VSDMTPAAPRARKAPAGRHAGPAAAWAGFFLAALLSTTAAKAAGGHHAVDDAAIMQPGACKLEGWSSAAGGSAGLLHAGGGCRVGPVELNAWSEYIRADSGSETDYVLQAKWAKELASGFSVGWSLAPSWQSHPLGQHKSDTAVALLTWAAHENLALHLNLGRDFIHGGPDQNRGGVAAEWTARPGWSLVAERYLDTGTHFVRAGARWNVRDRWSVDFSRAQRLHGPGNSNWTLGTSWQFERL